MSNLNTAIVLTPEVETEAKPVHPIEQTMPHLSLKPSYGFVSTKDLLAVFQAAGWQVSKVDVLNPRKADRKGFQRHLIRLEHPEYPSIPGLTNDNNSRVQLCLVNSHDGTTALRLFLGVLRIACLNGLIAGVSLRDFKAVHSKNVTSKLTEGIKFLTAGIPELIAKVQTLQNAKFTEADFQTFINDVTNARLKNVKKVISVDYSTLIQVRRPEDAATDAFTLINRVQETVIRGGIEYEYERDVKDAEGNVTETKVCSTTTRRLASVASQVNLNRLIWDRALTLAK